jgi:hypothetical protein
MLEDLNERLDKKAYEAAKLYYKMEDYLASRVAFRNVLKDDADNIYREDILYYIAMSSYNYARLSIPAKQKERYLVFVDDYLNFVGEIPESHYRKELDAVNRKAQKALGKNVVETGDEEKTEKEFAKERKELKKNENGTLSNTGLYVAIKPFEKKTYNFTSYGSDSGGTPYSSGTAAPTGNFKTLNSTECMQIVVLTNPGETSWEGKTFYVPIADDTRRQLYEANGTKIDVWVEITE